MSHVVRHPAVITAALAGLLLLVITAANYHFWPLWFVWLVLGAAAFVTAVRSDESSTAGRQSSG